ncbi:MAG TPA: hotdog domain-containing protein [Candidatus Angelobacter sp.]|jgi:predicted thioesterase|nr:hotdog domain-containing protein [Candidatus Angelobacter sp.]
MTSPATGGGSAPMPRIGLEATIEKVVPPEWTLAAFDPRLPAVFSTPAMIGMMEIAASKAVMPELPPGAITVGTRIEVDHLKAVPAGTKVRTTARLTEYRGRFLVFDVETRARDIVLGRGRVFRALVEHGKFDAQAKARKESDQPK